ncbi:hypothetical protein [Zongyangia hominis]|uniref:Uncharacterized protein n=1 Tax=Zongyangia hominis TaxID=2763677 RepID=A0A926EE73_9FIRM|nr:hypothetical protein [Zongyangia hominis]MBC8570799.1 hypothetical protein [Zongyangia hominis]
MSCPTCLLKAMKKESAMAQGGMEYSMPPFSLGVSALHGRKQPQQRLLLIAPVKYENFVKFFAISIDSQEEKGYSTDGKNVNNLTISFHPTWR